MASQDAGTRSQLERLPLLALEEICTYLSGMDPRRRSLFAFSQASRICCDAAKRERFERILFVADNGQQMEQATARWHSVLATEHRKRLVRRVRIIGSLIYDGEKAGPVRNHRLAELKALDMVHVDDLEDEDAFSRPNTPYSSSSIPRPSYTETPRAKADNLWSPVAEFIAELPGLQDLIWASTDHVPRCILDALHTALPRTRLRVYTFGLPFFDCLNDDDTDEYALTTSQNLYSICATLWPSRTEGNPSHRTKALQQMIAGPAPNLRRIEITMASMPGPVAAERQPWLEAFSDDAHILKGCLESFSLNWGQYGPFSQWALYIDVSKMQRLQLWTGKEDFASHAKLTEMAERDAFQNLDTLSIRVGCDYSIDEDQELTSLSTRLFAALRPLKVLFVDTQLARETKTAVLERHGASLQRLQLNNVSSLEGIQAIRDACPNLRHLRIGVQRSSGDKIEVATYEVLGSFPRLQSLFLNLHHTTELPAEPEPEAAISQRWRHELANAAQDFDLASAIWRVIYTANSQTRPDLPAMLSHLKITGVGRPPEDLRRHRREAFFSLLTSKLARTWVCEANVGIQEMIEEPAMRRVYDARLAKLASEHWKLAPDGDLVMPAWYAVWPEAEGKIDWMDFCHSTPLATEH